MMHSASEPGGLGASDPSTCKNQHSSPRLQYPVRIVFVSALISSASKRAMREGQTSSIVPARLVLIIWCEFFILPVEELAVLSCETPSRGFVEVAEASRFRG